MSHLRGFSLIETLVVVAMIAILAAIAAPSFQTMIRNNRLSAAASALQVSLNLARSEAVKRGADARVSVAANTAPGVWSNGWTVFADKTGTSNLGLAPTTDDTGSTGFIRLEVTAAPSGPVNYGQTGTLNYFTYNGQGRLISSTGAVVNRSFWFYDMSSASDKYCLIINSTGRIRTDRVSSTSSCTTE